MGFTCCMLLAAEPGVTLWGRVGLGFAIALGLFLWLFGGKLARPTCSVAGLCIGGLAALMVPGVLDNRILLPLFVVGGCVIGFTVAWLLFRACMALTTSLLLAALLPFSVLLWRDKLPPPLSPPPVTPAAVERPVGPASTTSPATQPSDAIGRWQLRIRTESRAFEQWWQAMSLGERRGIVTVTLAGLAGGMVLGLLAPYSAATLVSALAGSLLMVTGTLRLLVSLQDPGGMAMPGSRAMLVLVSLITIAGVALQWMIWRRNVDK